MTQFLASLGAGFLQGAGTGIANWQNQQWQENFMKQLMAQQTASKIAVQNSLYEHMGEFNAQQQRNAIELLEKRQQMAGLATGSSVFNQHSSSVTNSRGSHGINYTYGGTEFSDNSSSPSQTSVGMRGGNLTKTTAAQTADLATGGTQTSDTADGWVDGEIMPSPKPVQISRTAKGTSDQASQASPSVDASTQSSSVANGFVEGELSPISPGNPFKALKTNTGLDVDRRDSVASSSSA